MKLTVYFGGHDRSVLTDIKKERDNQSEIEGKQALFVVNLPEQKTAGEVLLRMLFDIGCANRLAPSLVRREIHRPNAVEQGQSNAA